MRGRRRMDKELVANIESYSWLSFLALCGAFMRAQRWQGPNGRILWLKVATEVPIAIAVGAVAAGAGAYFSVQPAVVGGLAGLMGLLGPAGFEAIISVFKGRFGVPPAEQGPKP